jgi:hypothetical protein
LHDLVAARLQAAEQRRQRVCGVFLEVVHQGINPRYLKQVMLISEGTGALASREAKVT